MPYLKWCIETDHHNLSNWFKAPRDNVSVQVILRAGHEAMMQFYCI